MQLSKRVSNHFGTHAALGETQMKVGGRLVSAVSPRRVQITCSGRRVPRKGVPERIVPWERPQPAMLSLAGLQSPLTSAFRFGSAKFREPCPPRFE
jgi:hypothetical protein